MRLTTLVSASACVLQITSIAMTILRAFLNWIILAVIIYAALQLFNRK